MVDRLASGCWRRWAEAAVMLLLLAGLGAASAEGGEVRPLSPTALVAARDGEQLFVACATANALLEVRKDGTVSRRLPLPGPPSGLALSPDGSRLAVTCAGAESVVCLVDVTSLRIAARLPARHTAMAPVFSREGRTLYVCNRFNDEVVAYDLASGKSVARIAVDREPIAASLTPDGATLFVVNHIPVAGPDPAQAAATISVIDTSRHAVAKTLRLPVGGGLALGVAVSPDGRHAAVTHNLARFNVPTTQLERGWINTAALTLIDVVARETINTVLLDSVERGAANPWAVAWTDDGARLLVTHAGTHELSVIDFPALRAKLERLPVALPPGRQPDPVNASNVRADVPNDLAFLTGLRSRVGLAGRGPRALALAGGRAWVAGYFSDSLDVVDPVAREPRPVTHALGPPVPMTITRRGEFHFNDATLCFQQWQSCFSCHSYDARVDGLNWDLLNDGIGNPKNAKSLLWAHRTPPAMSTGVRDRAETAVRAGIRHILFAVLPEEVPQAIDAYLDSLRPAPSPHLERGHFSTAARRGERLFRDRKVGCAVCHEAPLFTDLKSHDVGTRNGADDGTVRFDTPTLVENWRTAPYLHDGSAATMRDVLTTRNPGDRHGRTSQLSPAEIDDLAAYILSL